MRAFVSLVLLCGIFSAFAAAQSSQPTPGQTQTSQTQAVALANAAYAALTSAQIADGTVTGTAVWVHGPDQFSGSATVQFKGTGESRMDLSLGSFQRSEIWNDVAEGVPDGESIGEDGTPKHFVPHNCWVPSNWFSPVSVIASILNPNAILSYMGSETQNGIAVDHLQVALSRGQPTAPPKLSALIQRLSTADIYLDKTSHLPWSVKYYTHPDDDLSVDMPVEIRFAGYRSIQGVAIPFRFQRLIQGELNLDFTVTNAAINTGLSDSGFTLQ